MAELTRPLAELRRADEAAFGAKSASLGELLSAGIQVPPGFALSTRAFSCFVSESELEGVIADRLAGVSWEDLASVRAA
jgi:pyruvate,water dikinase